MKKLAVLIAASGLCAWSQSLDLSSVDKLTAKAKEVNKVTLDKDMLQLAMKMIPTDSKDDSNKLTSVMAGLESVQVRNLEFDKAGEYSDEDVEAVRTQMTKMRGCKIIVDSKEKNQHSQVFMCSQDGKPSGIAVIDSEPKELSIVFVKGNLNFSDLGKLNGVMGIPHIAVESKPDK